VITPGFAYIATAELAIDKHDYQLASKSLQTASELEPDDPYIDYLLAEAYRESDGARAAASLKQALTKNPRHVPSLILHAERLIDAEQYADARQALSQVLQVNRHQPRAHALRAVMAHLQGNYDDEQKHRERALAVFERNPEVDFLIGQKLSQKYRFAEGAQYQRRALEMDPNHVPAKFQLAQDLLRLGEEEEGWQFASSVHEADAYHVVAHNLMLLHDRLKEYATIEQDGFVVRMHAKEAAVYGRQVIQLLAAAKGELCAKYDVRLDRPVIVEIFPQQQDFAIRTFGLPGGDGYLGVCFGHVITANSPASQGRNPTSWHSVLWHEFCHVVTLKKTNNRMPRWLSEGISVYEERQRNPAWGQSMTPEYREMVLGEELTPVSELSSAFLSPASPLHLQFAYFESSLVVEYLIENHGLDVLKALLDDLGRGMPINITLSRHVESLDELDADFAEYARTKAKGLAPGVDFDQQALPESASTGQWKAWLEDHPNNYWGLKNYAAKLLADEDFPAAKGVLEKLVTLYPNDTSGDSALMMLAAVHRREQNTAAEWDALVRIAALKSDDVDVYQRLLEIAAEREDWQAVAKYAQELVAVNPLLPSVQEMLARAAEQLDEPELAVHALSALLELNPIDPAALHFRLANMLTSLEQPDKAKRHVLIALEEAPRYRDAHKLLLQLTDEEGQNEQAEGGLPGAPPEPRGDPIIQDFNAQDVHARR